MSQHKQPYDPRKDRSFQVQEVSPSSQYDEGQNPPYTPPLTYTPPTQRISGARLFLRKLFFGNTTPGTTAGRRTAFKRGLVLAMLVGLVIAIPFAVVSLIKGMAVLAVVLPAAMFVLGCVFAAGAVMCVYSCCVQLCNRRRRNTFEELTTYHPSQSHSSQFAEEEVNAFADPTLPQGRGEAPQHMPLDAATSSYYGAPQPAYGQPVTGYSFQPTTSGSSDHNVYDEFGGDVVEDGAFGPN